MPTVMQVIQRLLPRGTMLPETGANDSSPDWTDPPLWPPDLFAVAATLVSMSGCYAHADSTRLPEVFSSDYPLAVAKIGQRWASAKPEEGLPQEVALLWRELLDAGEEDVCARILAALPKWCFGVLGLMAIADEASAGIGFDSQEPFPRFFITSQWKPLVDEGFVSPGSTGYEARRRLTATTCRLVPADECCVQPKARTPQVGCTLRSLSHHLALLPPMGEVTTRWLAGGTRWIRTSCGGRTSTSPTGRSSSTASAPARAWRCWSARISQGSIQFSPSYEPSGRTWSSRSSWMAPRSSGAGLDGTPPFSRRIRARRC